MMQYGMFRSRQITSCVRSLLLCVALMGGQWGCANGNAGNGLSGLSGSALVEGEQLFYAGKLQEAEAIFTQTLQENMAQPKVLNARGYVYAKRGEWDLAIADFERAVQLVPQHTRYGENLGVAYLEAGFPKKAIPVFSTVLQRSPAALQSLNGRGLAFSRLRRHREAIHDFSDAIQIDSSNGELYLNRGVAYMKAGMKVQARKDFDQAIHHDVTLVGAFESRGLLALVMGDIHLAIDDFTAAIRLGSDGGLVHYNLGEALVLAGNQGKAGEEFQLACQRKVLQACEKGRDATDRHFL